MTQGHVQAIGAAVRPGSMRTPVEELGASGLDHRHRPHKECRICGTSLHCSTSRKIGLCRVCANDVPPIRLGKKTPRHRLDEEYLHLNLPHEAREVRALRQAAGFLQWQLGKLMGTNQAAVSAWERGRTPVKPETLDRVREICEEATHVNKAS